jgi:hypothetical protein
MMHRHLAITRKQAPQRRGIVRMQFTARQPIVRPQQRPHDHRRPRIQSQRLHQPDIVRQRRRRIIEQASDARPPLAGTRRRALIERIPPHPSMCIQHEHRRRLTLQRAQQPHQHCVLHAITKIPGVERVAVVHGAAAFLNNEGWTRAWQ